MEFCYGDLLKGLNIQKGDIIDVASDMASIIIYARSKKEDFNIDRLIDTLKESVGEEGTVMIRTFNWDFCHGTDFDIRTSPSRTGMLGAAALKRSDFKRTAHPIYSWMVWGKHTDELCAMNNISAFGEGSPFEFLYAHYGKQICLGNSNTDACTQLHNAEFVAGAPYRFDKPFTANYTDMDGNTAEATYRMPVRPLDVEVQADEFFDGERYDFLESKGIIAKTFPFEDLRCLVIDLRKLQDFVVDDIKNNAGINMVAVNGQRGYLAAGIDYSKARYF
jgi:aminoglycoside 3-N-acetyltransferase